MSISVVFLRSTGQDLKEVKSYIGKNFGKDTWQTSYSKIQETVGTLQIFPSRERYLKSLRSRILPNIVKLSQA